MGTLKKEILVKKEQKKYITLLTSPSLSTMKRLRINGIDVTDKIALLRGEDGEVLKEGFALITENAYPTFEELTTLAVDFNLGALSYEFDDYMKAIKDVKYKPTVLQVVKKSEIEVDKPVTVLVGDDGTE
jgi:hypothetical protein